MQNHRWPEWWNWKEADRTKLTEETRRAVLVVEALPPVGRDELETAVAELAGLIGRHCVGKTVTATLDRDRRETGVDFSRLLSELCTKAPKTRSTTSSRSPSSVVGNRYRETSEFQGLAQSDLSHLIAAASYCFAVFFAFSAALASRTFAFSAALALASRTFSHARTSRRRN